jgi:hypothetical protein
VSIDFIVRSPAGAPALLTITSEPSMNWSSIFGRNAGSAIVVIVVLVLVDAADDGGNAVDAVAVVPLLDVLVVVEAAADAAAVVEPWPHVFAVLLYSR